MEAGAVSERSHCAEDEGGAIVSRHGTAHRRGAEQAGDTGAWRGAGGGALDTGALGAALEQCRRARGARCACGDHLIASRQALFGPDFEKGARRAGLPNLDLDGLTGFTEPFLKSLIIPFHV